MWLGGQLVAFFTQNVFLEKYNPVLQQVVMGSAQLLDAGLCFSSQQPGLSHTTCSIQPFSITNLQSIPFFLMHLITGI